MSLEPIEPERALELYLADRENNVTQATIYSHRSRLGHFIRWCADEEITNLNELSGRQLHEFRIWRRMEGDLSPATEKTQMDTLRVFIKWLESIDGVEPDLHTKVMSPHLTGDDNIRDEMLESERADRILHHLGKYEYASRPHVVLTLMWHKWSRPCVIGSCTEGRNQKECEAMESGGCAVKCPFSKPPVALRHGYISNLRRQGVSLHTISDRCDVSEEIIEKHYSELSEEEKRELRRKELESTTGSNDGYL